MNKSFETTQPTIIQVFPARREQGIIINHLTVDISRTGKFDAVTFYFVDQVNREPVFRISAKDTSNFVSTPINLKSWRGAWLEIQVSGFGDVFVGVEYTSEKVDIFTPSGVLYKKYVSTQKEVKT